ncbi:MAG: LysR family transcriptional regulator [Rhodospirillales bacterium]|nr:LysR family transcriptional regulator [Rhodospirillales bacterium]
MNLTQLAYAKLVATYGSFTAAARAARVAQPTVSNAVSDLEAALGGKLFRRTTRRVELTSFGKSLLRHVEGVLSAADDLQREAQALLHPERKLLRVAFSQIIDSRRIMALFEPLRSVNTGMEIVYKECSEGDMEARLDEEQVDIVCGIRLRAAAGRGRSVLYRDRLRFLPRGGPAHYKGVSQVSLRDVARETLILSIAACGLAPATLELFRTSHLPVKTYPGQAISYRVLEEWSELGIGAAILPESRISGEAAAYPVVVSGNKPVSLVYEAVWNKTALSSPHLREAIRYLKPAAAALARGGAWHAENSATAIQA